ncbi:hypothetical protein AKO1_009204 [Acrasis kona]|uniref:Cyclase n=1 Tax=Acrasis kona TaxID=1008807 RepID=A0AAW2ZIR6_9EUKA
MIVCVKCLRLCLYLDYCKIHRTTMTERAENLELNAMTNLMRSIDISWPISEDMMSWKDNYPTKFISEAEYKKDGKRSTSLKMHCHSGTHVDAPSHFLKEGDSIESTSLKQLMGKCKVFDFSEMESVNETGKIQKNDFFNNKYGEESISEGDIILLKTKNSFSFNATTKWQQDFIYLDKTAANYLVKEKKIKAVGIDYTGIERSDIQEGHETHKMLLGNNVPIIEGLRLSHVLGLPSPDSKDVSMHQGIYYLICLPLKLVGVEAAPARAILIPIDLK